MILPIDNRPIQKHEHNFSLKEKFKKNVHNVLKHTEETFSFFLWLQKASQKKSSFPLVVNVWTIVFI